MFWEFQKVSLFCEKNVFFIRLFLSHAQLTWTSAFISCIHNKIFMFLFSSFSFLWVIPSQINQCPQVTLSGKIHMCSLIKFIDKSQMLSLYLWVVLKS